jgi:hypothetical protein
MLCMVVVIWNDVLCCGTGSGTALASSSYHVLLNYSILPYDVVVVGGEIAKDFVSSIKTKYCKKYIKGKKS